MCGARIGCIVSKNKEVMSTAMKFAQARLSPPTYAQIASEAALDTPQSYFDDVIKEYKERRDTLVSELQKVDGVKEATERAVAMARAVALVSPSDLGTKRDTFADEPAHKAEFHCPIDICPFSLGVGELAAPFQQAAVIGLAVKDIKRVVG